MEREHTHRNPRQMHQRDFLQSLKGALIRYTERDQYTREPMEITIEILGWSLAPGSHIIIRYEILRTSTEKTGDLDDLKAWAQDGEVEFINRKQGFRAACIAYDTLPP